METTDKLDFRKPHKFGAVGVSCAKLARHL